MVALCWALLRVLTFSVNSRRWAMASSSAKPIRCLMLRRFRLEEPETVQQASELLGQFADSAKIYAGGTELLLAMKEGLVQYERLVNIKGVSGLNEVKQNNGSIQIGAL